MVCQRPKHLHEQAVQATTKKHYHAQMKKLIPLLALLIPCHIVAKETYNRYTADYVRTVDGDTIELDVYVWPGQTNRIHLRLVGINTPEKFGKVSDCERAAGKKASAFVEQTLQAVDEVTISELQPDKYGGRMLGKLLVPEKGDLAQLLIKEGLAKEYDGGKRGGWCE